MIRMLCWTEVEDLDRWHEVLVSHRAEHAEYGLVLEHLWCEVEEPTKIHFVFLVEDIDKANEYMALPHHEQAAKDAGAISGGYKYVEPAGDY